MGNSPSEDLEAWDDYTFLTSVYEQCGEVEVEPYVVQPYPRFAGLLKTAFESVGVLAYTLAKVVGSDSLSSTESWTDSSSSTEEDWRQPRKHTRTQSCPSELTL